MKGPNLADAWMKFYPQDWRADERLRNCGLAARGLWMEVLALMHRSERYGYLLINGKTPTERQLAVQVGTSLDELSGLISELESEAVFSRDRNGTIYSRRMIRDEKRAKTARQNGKHGGNPTLRKESENPAQDNQQLNLSDKSGDKAQKPEARSQPPEYSSLPSSHTTPRATDCFNEVCTAADWRPASDTQRQHSISVLEGWLAIGCSLDLILASIRQALKSDPSPTRSLKRFDSTVRGKRKDEAGELPVTGADIRSLTEGIGKRLAVQ